jgi:hypothetical protein
VKNIGLFHFAQANMMPSLREATRNMINAGFFAQASQARNETARRGAPDSPPCSSLYPIY